MDAARSESSDEGGADVKTITVALVERRASARYVMAFHHEGPHVAKCQFGGRRQSGDPRAYHDCIVALKIGHNP